MHLDFDRPFCYAHLVMGKRNDKPATGTDVLKIVNEAADAILTGVERMFKAQDKHYDERFDRYDKRFDRVDQRLVKLEAGQSDLKRQLTDLKLDAPTRKEFNTLKISFDRFHPTSD